jgi:chromatin-remodeling ATPase INO80
VCQNGPRRYPPRTRTNHRSSVADEGEGDLDESMVEDGPMMTEEEMRLASSDLEDCQEIWMSELSDYILETRKRHREVEAFYKLTVIVCSSTYISIWCISTFLDYRNATPTLHTL